MTRLLGLVLSATLLTLLAAGCAPRLMETGAPVGPPQIGTSDDVVMDDGAHLPMRVWSSPAPRAIILGIHGFNDYSNAFDMPGTWFAQHGVTIYAFDQRGFGRAPGVGLWAGGDRMTKDLADIIRLLHARHPGLPLYLLGESMGGGVVMRMYMMSNPPKVDGVILAAPAVWGWRSLNAFYETVLWVAGHTVPSMTVTGRGLKIKPSDNIPMLRALGRDPLVIKGTQIGTIYGLVTLMDEASDSAGRIDVPVLLMYGAHDEIVPPEPVAYTLGEMRIAHLHLTTACYRNGWHMLLRDLEREVVWSDIAAWMQDPKRALPSGAQNLAPCEDLAKVH